jgi:hypothetical protein
VSHTQRDCTAKTESRRRINRTIRDEEQEEGDGKDVLVTCCKIAIIVEVEVTLRLTVCMSWYLAPLWDLRPDIISCRNVAVLFLWGVLSDERTVCNLQCNHSMVQFYPQALGYLYVASYDSKGFDRGYRTSLHAGNLTTPPFISIEIMGISTPIANFCF